MTDQRPRLIREYAKIDEDKAMATLVALGDIVVANTDRDDGFEECIDVEVKDALVALGVLVQCDECAGGYFVAYGYCPREHPCDTCGLLSCECCNNCECYPCECCDECGKYDDDCTCDEDGGLG